METGISSLRIDEESLEASQQVLQNNLFSGLNQYGLWDSITGDLFSIASRDSDVHHARQRSADILNFDSLNIVDDSRGTCQKTAAADTQVRSKQSANEATAEATDKVKKTVYVADVHYQVSEQELAKYFGKCGPIVDFRICGDTSSILRFAFVEFHSVRAAKSALKLSGTVLGESVIRVSPSKTAIIPVKDQFLPRSERERDLVSKTIYVTNIHQTVERDILKQFFQMVCGPVSKIRLLGDAQHDTKIAFVEFASKTSTTAALRCTGAMLGPLAIRVSPSKTPVRTDARRRAGSAENLQVPADTALAAAKITSQLTSSLRQDHAAKKSNHGHKKSRQPKCQRNPNVAAGSAQHELGLKGSNQERMNLDRKNGQQREGHASPTILSLLESILSD
jgi:RNA recognition motif-containing protein